MSSFGNEVSEAPASLQIWASASRTSTTRIFSSSGRSIGRPPRVAESLAGRGALPDSNAVTSGFCWVWSVPRMSFAGDAGRFAVRLDGLGNWGNDTRLNPLAHGSQKQGGAAIEGECHGAT